MTIHKRPHTKHHTIESESEEQSESEEEEEEEEEKPSVVQAKRFHIVKPPGSKHHVHYDSRVYPFLGVSFFDAPPHFVQTDHPFTHRSSEPEQCAANPCDYLAKENAALKDKVRELEAKLAKAESNQPTYNVPNYGS